MYYCSSISVKINNCGSVTDLVERVTESCHGGCGSWFKYTYGRSGSDPIEIIIAKNEEFEHLVKI